jgi:serine/threonine protein phosphatase 1
MRILAIGDIHGQASVLDHMLEVIELRSEDRLITLGDYVDRGPDSRGVLNRLIALSATGQLVALLGNHDEMMLEGARQPGPHRRAWLRYGGLATLQSYGLSEAQCEQIPEAHLAFLAQLPSGYETDTHLFVHASVDPCLSLDQQSTDTLRWHRVEGPIQHLSGKTLICGHTRQPHGWPLVWPGGVCIDTGAYEDEGWLTCLEVHSGKFWQVNQKGKVRVGDIRDVPVPE